MSEAPDHSLCGQVAEGKQALTLPREGRDGEGKGEWATLNQRE